MRRYGTFKQNLKETMGTKSKQKTTLPITMSTKTLTAKKRDEDNMKFTDQI